MRDVKACELEAGATVDGRVVASVVLLPWEPPGIFADDDPRLYLITYEDGTEEERSGGEYLAVE